MIKKYKPITIGNQPRMIEDDAGKYYKCSDIDPLFPKLSKTEAQIIADYKKSVNHPPKKRNQKK